MAKEFKDAQEEREYWLKLATSPFWEGLSDVISDREEEILKLLIDPRVPRDNDARLTGRLVELKWLKDLPLALLNTVAMTNLTDQADVEVEETQRLVGKPDSKTGLL